ALVHEILSRSDRDFATRGFGIWLLEEKDTNCVIGFCGLRNFHDFEDLEILYALSESSWHRGYALEAAQTVLSHALDSLGLPRLIGVIDIPNHASWRVLEKLQMTEFRPPPARANFRYAVATRSAPKGQK